MSRLLRCGWMLPLSSGGTGVASHVLLWAEAVGCPGRVGVSTSSCPPWHSPVVSVSPQQRAAASHARRVEHGCRVRAPGSGDALFPRTVAPAAHPLCLSPTPSAWPLSCCGLHLGAVHVSDPREKEPLGLLRLSHF